MMLSSKQDRYEEEHRQGEGRRREEVSLEKSSRAAGDMKCTTSNLVSAQINSTLERQKKKKRGGGEERKG